MPLDDLERLLEELESAPDEPERRAALQLLTPLLELHRDAFRRIVEILGSRGQKALVAEMLADPLLGSLMRGYGLDSVETAAPSHATVVPLEQLIASGKAKSRSVPLLHQFELRHGDFFKVQFFEEEVLVCNVEGQAFAFKNRCPESGAPLEKAELKQYFITCPCHQYTYDLRTGIAAESAGRRLEIMPVTLENGVIRVDL